MLCAVFGLGQGMNKVKLIIGVVLLAAWLGACYALRFTLMEDARWLDVCATTGSWVCGVRSQLGLIIHWQLLAYAALACALPALLIKGKIGRTLAVLGLFLAAPALVLYTASLGAPALLLSALRWVRAEPA